MQKHLLFFLLRLLVTAIAITAFVTVLFYDEIVLDYYAISVAIVVIFGIAYFAGLILHMKSQ